MNAIRILENCSTAHRGFKRGEVVAVDGADLSAEEAGALVRCQRAVACELPAEPVASPDKAKTQKRKAE